MPFDTWHLDKTYLLVTESRWPCVASRLLLTADAQRFFFPRNFPPYDNRNKGSSRSLGCKNIKNWTYKNVEEFS